jgi:hypothetical protein
MAADSGFEEMSSILYFLRLTRSAMASRYLVEGVVGRTSAPSALNLFLQLFIDNFKDILVTTDFLGGPLSWT